MFTKEMVDSWIEENKEECLEGLRESNDIPAFMKNLPGVKDVWIAGCWLNEMLKQEGATETQVEEIGFAHGQRSFGGDTIEWAIKYANEFCNSREVVDKPGGKLALEIFEETFVE